jgi:chromosome segregation ATPase
MRGQKIRNILLAMGLVALLAPGALAGEKSECEKKSRHLVFGDQFDNITINTEGSELTITMSEDGKSKVAVVDMSQVGLLVNEGMSELAEALAELQMEFRMGQDNSISLSVDDEEWQVDLDAIMAEVGEALSDAFQDMDTDSWSHHSHHYVVSDDEEDLQEELEDLRQELKELQRELKKMRKKVDDS